MDIIESRSFKNKRLETLREIEAVIDWTRVEAILNKNYPVCQDGPAPYPPLMLFKCLLLQKWFNIKADTELETQINDSNAFRSFLGLPWSSASPDHSTFSRFRGRLTKYDFERLTSDILTQFSEHGIKVNECAWTILSSTQK
ncbi:MAG: transposase [Desulfovermiculus sp.]|nr:transposase [Desulfovermiculus sp.]